MPARLLAVAVWSLALSGQAWAWGATGHREIARVAIRALPPEVPAFVRSPDAVARVAELAREPDRSKGAGQPHESDRDAAHYVDFDDAGRVLGGPSIEALPPTRVAYQKALAAVGTDEVEAGYLPYALADGWQQLVKDFAYWRVAAAAERRATSPERAAWFAQDRALREALVIRDLGVWAHFVGDASQPMHLSIHYNGWGDYPNPEGFTQAKVHGAFEGAYVRANIAAIDVARMLPPYAPCPRPVAACVRDYLKAGHSQVLAYFRLEKAGGFAPGDPRGRAFVEARLAAGAAQLRDFVVDAWRASAKASVGWPAVRVEDVEASRVDPFEALYGTD